MPRAQESRATSASLTEQLQASQDQSTQLEAQLQASRDQSAQLQAQLLASEGQVAELEAQLQASQAEGAALVADHGRVAAELECSQQAVATLTEELQQAVAKLVRCASSLSFLGSFGRRFRFKCCFTSTNRAAVVFAFSLFRRWPSCDRWGRGCSVRCRGAAAAVGQGSEMCARLEGDEMGWDGMGAPSGRDVEGGQELHQGGAFVRAARWSVRPGSWAGALIPGFFCGPLCLLMAMQEPSGMCGCCWLVLV